MWDVFKSSTEKLASCHMELVKKLQELIKDVQKYVEEQAKAHKKVRNFWTDVPLALMSLSLRPVNPHPQLICHGRTNRTGSKNWASNLWSRGAFTKTKKKAVTLFSPSLSSLFCESWLRCGCGTCCSQKAKVIKNRQLVWVRSFKFCA